VDFPSGTTEHPINKSGKKKILVSVWDFGAVYPQSERSLYLCNDHPAKMRPCLARAILQIYGESPVLDPMAGVGTTLVEAMLLGMTAVGVEFEKKFVDQTNKNIERIKKLSPNKNLGKAICIRGDARDLSCLKTRILNSVIFSPPYFNAIESVSTGHQGPEGGHLERQHKLAKERRSGYGDGENIGHAEKYGSIIFSPPYFNALKKGDEGPHSKNKRISYDERIKRFQGYSTDSDNIGNIRQFGSVILSPSYMSAIKGSGRKREEAIEAMRKAGVSEKRIRTFMGELGCIKWQDEGYSLSRNQIGNLNGTTYLGEMFKVYSECFRVLKPSKFMVVVVKDIRRKGLTIPLGADTIKLCQMAGFEIFDIIVNKMYFPSFWQLTHAQKTQAKGIPMTLRTHEYVLVFRKPPR